MSSSARKLEFQPSVATSVRVDRSRFYVLLADGREISAPLDRFPRLLGATPAQRNDCEITAFGTAVRWPQLARTLASQRSSAYPKMTWKRPPVSSSANRTPSDCRGFPLLTDDRHTHRKG
jgi:Protein of unknown function (DUF2442)